MEELSANPNRAAKGTVIEANPDRTRGTLPPPYWFKKTALYEWVMAFVAMGQS
jgi:hypothetical protein